MESVKTQTFDNYEYIVWDANSTDGTSEVIFNFLSQGTVYINEKDAGIYDGMNKALEVSNGKFILFLNSGDVFFGRNTLEEMNSVVKKNQSDVYFFSWIVKNKINVQSATLVPLVFNHQAVLYNKFLHRHYGLYISNPNFITADYTFFKTIESSDSTKIFISGVVVAVIDANGVSAQPKNFAQKTCVDYLFGNISRIHLLTHVFLHPFYYFLKKVSRFIKRN